MTVVDVKGFFSAPELRLCNKPISARSLDIVRLIYSIKAKCSKIGLSTHLKLN